MIEVIRIALVFLLIVILVVRKWQLGWVMVIVSVFVGALYLMGPHRIVGNLVVGAIDPTTLYLVAVIYLVYVIGNTQQRSDSLRKVLDALKSFVRNRKIILISIPTLVGLLPMPGGALFSAPSVQEMGRELDLSGERKTIVNYWFRHYWEWVLPLYPGIILASSIVGVPERTVIIANSPLFLAAVIIGFVPLRGISSGSRVGGGHGAWRGLRSLVANVWPIPVVIFCVIVFSWKLIYVLIGVILLLWIVERMSWSDIFAILKQSMRIGTLGLVISVMVFKHMLEVTKAAEGFADYLVVQQVSTGAVLFIVPFVVGMLTGITQAFVGATFPMLIPLMVTNVVHQDRLMLAYCGGFCGVLLSPTHLCLVLTKDYFRADFAKVYQQLIPLVLFVILAGVFVYLIRGA